MNNIQQKTSSLADRLNMECFCMTLDRNRLVATLQSHVDMGPLWRNLASTHPHLFAATPALISDQNFDRMKDMVQVIEKLSHSKVFQKLRALRCSLNSPKRLWTSWGPDGL